MELPSWKEPNLDAGRNSQGDATTVGIFIDDFLLMFSVFERLGVVGFFWDHLDLVFMFHPKLKVCVFFELMLVGKKEALGYVGFYFNIWFSQRRNIISLLKS